MDGEAYPKKALKFRDIYSWSNSNIIGLRIPSYSQSFFSLQVVGPFSVVGYLHWKAQLLVNISYTSLMMGQNPETSLKLDCYVMVILIVHSKSVILLSLIHI